MSAAPSSPKDSRAGLRNGEQYLRQLRDDGRQVIYDGEIVRDVASHPAFRGQRDPSRGYGTPPQTRQIVS